MTMYDNEYDNVMIMIKIEFEPQVIYYGNI